MTEFRGEEEEVRVGYEGEGVVRGGGGGGDSWLKKEQEGRVRGVVKD